MKVLVVYASIHHKNTQKVAEVIGGVLSAETVPFFELNQKQIKEADLVGFGSGVYFSKFHKALIKKVNDMDGFDGKKVFIFSTSGLKKNFILNRSHYYFKKLLQKKGADVIGEFNCLGLDTNGPLKMIGGINKNRPNQEDIKKAKSFAKNLSTKF